MSIEIEVNQEDPIVKWIVVTKTGIKSCLGLSYDLIESIFGL